MHYLRSSLDDLVYNASWTDLGAPQNGTQFPIFEEREKWSSKKGATKHLGGMSAQHSAIIESVKPFNGGQWAKDLQALSNADKHRIGIEVSPTVQLHVHIGGAIADPNNPGVRLAQIEEISLRLLMPALGSREFADVFNAMFVGAAEAINPFLQEQGLETIKTGGQRTVTADGVIVPDDVAN